MQSSLFLLFTLYAAALVASASPTVERPAWCPSPSYYCHRSDECKPAYVRCDGTVQCLDGEDEENCSECTAENAASTNQFYCNNTGICISQSWKCDGTEDCGGENPEDEADCTENVQCSNNQFDCGDGQCIDSSWYCDVQVDCNNGADENSCTATCAPNQFVCNASTPVGHVPECISDHWKCDGEEDCPSGEDEWGCGPRTCPEDRFNCSAENKCMTNTWRCDGDNDCASGEDEKDCHIAQPVPSRQCSALEFQCAIPLPSACIVGAWKCDGEEDCADGSDEKDCPARATCTDSEFACGDGSCIPLFLTCSGKSECHDGSDERLPSCATNTTHTCDLAKGEFSCGPGTHTCVNISKVCDQHPDCPKVGNINRDEDTSICGDVVISDICAENLPCGNDPLITCNNIKHQSAEEQFNRTIGYVCQCPPGYNKADNKCFDKNECGDTENPVCDHICINHQGTYKCDCNVGYSLEVDGRSCKVNGDIHPRLLFSNRHEIRAIHIHGQQKYMPLLDSAAAVALDFDYATNKVFYSDMKEKKLYKFTLPGPDEDVDELQEQDLKIDGVQTPDGLAYDWVYKHLYWTDTSTNTINMACVDDDLETPRKSVVLYQNANPNCTLSTEKSTGKEVCIDEPRALAVHPRKGWAFWSDWGANPHIVLAALDGSKMEMIAYNTGVNNRQYLHWPNGLTIDLSAEYEKLYWIDAKLHSLFSCTIDRCINDITVLVYNDQKIKHPFSITVFENQLYWSDWATKHIVTANKYTGGNITSLLTNLEQPMDLKVFHPMTQQNSTNHCKVIQDSTDRCDHICVPKPWSRDPTTSDYSPVDDDLPKHTCLCATGYTLNPDGRTCQLIETDTKPAGKPLHESEAHRAPQASLEKKDGKGSIAIIASCTVLGVAVIVGVVAAVAVKRLRRSKSKRMNFDNPIYKRTTEDKLELPRHEYQPSETDPSAVMPLTSSESVSTSNEDFDV